MPQKHAVEYAKEIEDYKTRINNGLDLTEGKIKEYAEAETEYKKILAITMMKLETNGVPVTVREKYAHDDEEVVAAHYRQIVAEKSLKAHFDKINSLESCMNATQSQNRHLTGA